MCEVLYYACVVNPAMLVALNTIAAEQSNRTESTAKVVTNLLNNYATHSEVITRYQATGMILHIHIYALFLSETEAKSRSGGL